MSFKPANVFQAAVVLVVAAAIVTGFIVVGSPAQERARKFDQQRINSLQQLSSAIEQYYNLDQRYTLPTNLQTLTQTPNIYVSSLVDPETGASFNYIPGNDGKSYSLCATFETDVTATSPKQPYMTAPYPSAAPGADFWNHPMGLKCFTLTPQTWPKP